MIANRPRPEDTAAYFTAYGITPKASVYLARLPNGGFRGYAVRRACDRTPEYDAGVEDGIAVRNLVFAPKNTP